MNLNTDRCVAITSINTSILIYFNLSYFFIIFLYTCIINGYISMSVVATSYASDKIIKKTNYFDIRITNTSIRLF